jgi:HSP20 family molecular chaperone IbpA
MRYPIVLTRPAMEEFRTPVLSLFDQMLTEFFKPFSPLKEINDVKTRSYPKVDVRRALNDLIFEAAIPFVKNEDLDITLEKNSLRISGKVVKEESIKDEHFIKRELVRSSFSRSFALDELLFEKWERKNGLIKADLKDGLLTVTLSGFFADPVEAATPVRKIAIS